VCVYVCECVLIWQYMHCTYWYIVSFLDLLLRGVACCVVLWCVVCSTSTASSIDDRPTIMAPFHIIRPSTENIHLRESDISQRTSSSFSVDNNSDVNQADDRKWCHTDMHLLFDNSFLFVNCWNFCPFIRFNLTVRNISVNLTKDIDEIILKRISRLSFFILCLYLAGNICHLYL